MYNLVKSLKSNLSFIHWQIHLILLIFLFFLSNGHVIAQEKSKKKSKPFDVEVSLASFYDNNILKYSDKYLELFKNGLDKARFHINTYDDIVFKPSLALDWTFNILKKQKSRISLDYSYSAYIVNDVKNWSMFTAGFQQYLTRRASFKVFYTYIPEFYVRHFRDEDLVNYYKKLYGYGYIPETFVPFSFAKDDFGFWIQNTIFKNTRIKLNFDYARYYHNLHYTEYDCKNFAYGFQIFQGITKNIRIDLGYEFGTSDAKGYDQTDAVGYYDPTETKATSDDADATNEGDEFSLGIDWQLPAVFKLKNALDCGITFSKRYYTTDHYVEEDPEHAGRVDNNLYMRFGYNVKLNKSMDLSIFYKWYGRDSSTKSPLNSEYVSNEKDYKQSQVGLEFSYSFKL